MLKGMVSASEMGFQEAAGPPRALLAHLSAQMKRGGGVGWLPECNEGSPGSSDSHHSMG